jgi:hypothetical protein
MRIPSKTRLAGHRETAERGSGPASPEVRKEATGSLHVRAILLAEPLGQLSFFDRRAYDPYGSDEDQRYCAEDPIGRHQEQDDRYQRKNRVHRMSHEPVRSVCDELVVRM